MKTQIILLQTLMLCITASSTVAKRQPFFVMPVMGYTDLDAIDYGEGVASGLFGRDVRGQWDGCIQGFPLLGYEMYVIAKNIITNLSNPVYLLTNFGNY